MLNFFKHSYLAQLIAIVLIAIVLWLPAFITKSAFIPGDYNTPLYTTIVHLFDFSPFLINLVAFSVYLLNVFLFNSILSANRLVNKYSTIGALSFLLMMCCAPELHSCYPFIFACPFVLMTMHTLFLIHHTENPENYMMNIGYFVAIASLFYYPSVFVLIWVLISFVILGFNKIRYFLIPMIGFLIVNALFLGITYLTGDIENLIKSYSHFFNNIQFSYDLKYYDKILLPVFVILFIISLLRTISDKTSDRGTNIRKRIGVAIVLTLLSMIIFFLQKPLMNNSMIFMMFAFFYAISLSNVKKTRLANIIIIVMFLMIIVNQYLPLFITIK